MIATFCNVNRSNHKNMNTFLKILADQKTVYLISQKPAITVINIEKILKKVL